MRNSKLMKHILLILLLLCGTLYGQVVQYGNVTEMSSGRKPLGSVAVTIPSVHDCQPTMSDSRGQFRLKFAEHTPGDVVHGIRAQKKGYEVVNIHVLRDWTLTTKDTLRIVMAPEGKVKEAKMHYYDLVENQVIRRYDSTMRFLNGQMAEQGISPTEFDFWKAEAEQELSDAYAEMDVIADRFARLNEDDTDQATTALLGCLKADKMDEAIGLASNNMNGTVLETFHSFKVAFPATNLEEAVAEIDWMEPLVDSLSDNLKAMSVYARLLEDDFAVAGLKYAKACTYVAILYKDMALRQRAEAYFKKARAMFGALHEMDGNDYTKQIGRINAWMNEL